MAAVREKVVQAAERLVARGKVDAAIREYRKVLAEHPRDTNTLNRVGDLYARIEKIEEAVSLFIRTAEHYTEDGFFVKAIAIYKKIIKLDPTRLDVYERLAELYHRQGLVTEARSQYQVLVDYYQKHKQPAAATKICRRMLDLEPKNLSHRARLADLLENQGQVVEAMAEYRVIAERMVADGQLDGALKVYEKALDLSADDLDFVAHGVRKLREAGESGAAARLLAVAVKRNPQAEALARSGGLESSGVRAQAPPPTVAPAAAAPLPSPPPSPPRAAAPPSAPRFAALEGELATPSEVEALAGDLDETASKRRARASAPAPAAAPPVEDEEVFVFDLEEEEPPSSLVRPPADMAASDRVGSALVAGPAAPPLEAVPSEDEEIELLLEDVEAELGGPGVQAVLDGDVEIEVVDEDLGGSLGAGSAPALAFDDDELDMERFSLDAPPFVEEPSRVEDLMVPPRESPLRLDTEALVQAANSIRPQRVDEEDDLLTEAEVLAKYGLREKALEKLDELFQLNPRNLNAYTLRIGLCLEEGLHDRVVILANEMAAIAAEEKQPELWEPIRRRLANAGFRLGGERLILGAPGSVARPAGEAPRRPAAPPDLDEQEIVFELEELDLDSPPELSLAAEAAPAEGLLEALSPLPALEPSEPEEPSFELRLDELEELPEMLLPAVEPTPPPAVSAPAPPVVEARRTPSPAPPQPFALAPPAARGRKAAKDIDLDATIAALASSVRLGGASKSRPPAAPPLAALREPVETPEAPLPPAVEAPLVPTESTEDLGALFALDDTDTALPAAPPSQPELPAFEASDLDEIEIFDAPVALPAAPSKVASASLDDTGVSWLDEVSQGGVVAKGDDKLFGEEDGFFDLAAELEEELKREDGARGGDLFGQPNEQTLEEIVEGFKRGVAEHLSPEDFETHFNLGIAYREMGLIDEAIGEFQIAAKDPKRLVDCCSLLGMSFLDKGLPELAVKWYRRALDHPGLPDDEVIGLMYDLGSAYVAAGDRENAYRCFVDVYGINTNYRDVVARLEELAP